MMKRIKDRIDILEREVQQERNREEESDAKHVEAINHILLLIMVFDILFII